MAVWVAGSPVTAGVGRIVPGEAVLVELQAAMYNRPIRNG
jgi:hypothetical protein